MKNIRLRRGDLQVATHSYYNDMTGRYFHLIGVCHFGSPEFWDSTNERVETLRYAYPDAVVHYEGVRDDTPENHFNNTRPVLESAGQAMGLTYQSKGLYMEDDWVRTDLTLSQVLAKLDDPDAFLSKHDSMVSAMRDLASSAKQSKAFVPVVRWLIRHVLALHAPRKTNEYRVVIDERNRHAVSTMVSTGTDIITLWGAGHLKGMRKILEGCGYELLSTDWDTCIPRHI